jgi:hypothetical protein
VISVIAFLIVNKRRRKREEGRGKREEGRRKKEEGRGKNEEGRRKKVNNCELFSIPNT